ncbi:MAG: hypothetical protein E7330_01725 [Clostridiales bacterium]|nr:hypothetical protein [Clostridiales bacterium]
MKKKFGILLLTLALAALLLIPAVGLADAGSFAGDTDFGSDWGSDFGSDWGSSSDWDDDWSSSSSSWDDDDDYYYSGSDYTTTSSDDGGGISFGAIIIVVIIIVLILGRSKSKGAAKNTTNQPVRVNAGAQRTMLPMTIAQLKQMDPNFSEEAMKEHIANLYIRMQNCWSTKNWEEMRASMTDSLFNQMGSQLQTLIRGRQTNYVERIAVLGVDLTGFGQDENKDMLTAIVQTRIVDYTLRDDNGELVSGSRTAEKFLTYEWLMVRSKGAVTGTVNGQEARNCPNCGAPLDLNHTAKCNYCGSIITAEEHDWVLSAIKGISQRTS